MRHFVPAVIAEQLQSIDAAAILSLGDRGIFPLKAAHLPYGSLKFR
jgi:hypothetical protein